MGKVVLLDNWTRLDIPPDKVLQGAVGELESVVLLGYDREGREYFASSLADVREVLWLVERFRFGLLGIVDHIED